MIDFQTRDFLSALALIVSGLSLYISWRTSQRAEAEKSVNGWIDLKRMDTEWWLATLNIKNNSHIGIEIAKLVVDLPDYRLCDLKQANLIKSPDGTMTQVHTGGMDHHLAMPFKHIVASGETLQRQFMLYQPAHSQRRSTLISAMYWTLEPKRQWRFVGITVETRNNL